MMQTMPNISAAKLTLSLNKTAIAFAKEYAASVGKSVSSITEDFFNSLSQLSRLNHLASEKSDALFSASPIVSEIAGVISLEALSSLGMAESLDYKSEYTAYLEKKYGG